MSVIKIRCLGAKPYGRQPIYIEEMKRLVAPAEIFDAIDGTWADQLIYRYPGCLEIVPALPPEEKVLPSPQQKIKIVSNSADKATK